MQPTINRPAVFLLWALFCAFTLAKCADRTYFCDDFADGACRDRREAVRSYAFQMEPARARTWRAICDHMYFHSRETPGIRHDFGRRPDAARRAQLRSSLHCGYRLRSRLGVTQGELEGRRLDEDGDGFWCFDYLGAMLKKHLDRAGVLDAPPDPGLFPISLELWFQTDPQAAAVRLKSEVSVRWSGP